MTESIPTHRFFRFSLGLALVLIVAAFWLRVHDLTVNPLWLDEAYSAFGADKGFAFIWNVLPGYETHPPFYTALLRTWTLVAGNSLGSLRWMGVLAGLATLPMIWLCARELARSSGRPTAPLGLAALALATVMPTLIEIARSVRPYSVLALVYTAGIFCVLKLARTHRDGVGLPAAPWLGYLAALVLLVWLHSLGSLYAGSLGLALLVLAGPASLLRDHWRRYLVGHALVLLAVAPAFAILFDQAGTWTKSTWVRFLPEFLPMQLIRIYGLPLRLDLAGMFCVVASIFLAVRGATLLGPEKRRIVAALLILAALPVIASIVLTITVSPVFIERTMMACGVPWLLLIAAGATDGLVPRVTFVALLGLLLLWTVRWTALAPDQDWYGATRWLMPRMAKGDVIYAYPNEGALPFHYALRDLGQTATVREIPSPIPARDKGGWYPTGSRGVQSLHPWRIEQIAADPISRRTKTIWLLRLNQNYYDPGDNFLNVMMRGRKVVGHYRLRGIDIVGLSASAQSTPPEKAKP